MMIEQLFDTGSLKSKRQMTPNSPSVLGLTVGNLPSSIVKSPMNGATSPSKSRTVALSAEQGSRTQLLATAPPLVALQHTVSRQARAPSHLAPGMRDRAPEQQPQQGLCPWLHPAHLRDKENSHTPFFPPEMKSKLAFIHILKTYIFSLISNHTRPRFKQCC